MTRQSFFLTFSNSNGPKEVPKQSFSDIPQASGIFFQSSRKDILYRIKATNTHLDKSECDGRFALIHLPETSCCLP